MIYIGLILLGLCLGSFINALVWRIHEQFSDLKTKNQDLSILSGRSMCPNCQHVLSPKDLIPVVSWLFLKGKCRYCTQSISLQYPAVELVSALLFLGSYLAWPYGFHGLGLIQFIIWLIIVVGLVALFVYDLKWMILPDKITYPLIVLAIASAVIQAFTADNLTWFLINLVLSLVISSGFFYVLFQASKGKWIGGGDVKFGLIFGFLLVDPFKSILVIFSASILGTLLALPMLARRQLKMKAKIPFGPLLIVASVAIYLYGDRLIDWYLHSLLLV